MVRTIYGGMGQVQRNIAMTNLKKIMTKRKDVVLLTTKLGSVLLEDRKMKQGAVKSIRKWAQEWATKRKTLIIVNLIMVAEASRSAKDNYCEQHESVGEGEEGRMQMQVPVG